MDSNLFNSTCSNIYKKLGEKDDNQPHMLWAVGLTHWSHDKMAIILRLHIQMHFIQWKYLPP